MLDKETQQKLIQQGRDFMHGYRDTDPYQELFESDQDLKLPQPPLVKAPMAKDGNHITLPKDFSNLPMLHNLPKLIESRRSARIYTQETMTLAQLSFLLWSCQGVKSIRGKSYATLRTVPSGGARHAFETYLMVRKVDGLKNGAYHYLPLEHALEFLYEAEDMDDKINESLCGQNWASKANVLFYWSMVPYRAEWRYGIYAHRVALMDAGHMAENLYLACTGLGLGCCAIGAFRDELCSKLFSLEGEEEFMLYVVPVGTVRSCDRAEEQSFYKFIEAEGL